MKKLFSSLLLALLPAAALAGAPPVIPEPPPVSANGYILMDFGSGRVLAEQRADERMEPASITKVMSAYVVFDAIKDKRLQLTDMVTVSEYAWRTGGAVTDGSTSFLELNSQVSVDNLLKGMIVQSGNDATIALAEKVGGTEAGFVTIMNEYARRLGLKSTRFTNSWGNPSPDHYTTARDLAVLAQALIRDFPELYKLYSMREFTWNKHRQFNRNGLLARDPSVDGIKTGHTNSAKYCLMTSASRDGMRLISVVLGAPSIKGREDASASLLNYGYQWFETVKLHDAGKTLLTPPVFKGEADAVKVGTSRAMSVTIARGAGDSITKEASIQGPLVAPLAAGAQVGQYIVRVGDEVVARVPLVTLEKVEEAGFFGRMIDSVKLWFED
ncbi:MAG TPA: D-alanyl-D-alanine carboxypeptidase family protein [Steroidobacteraceae bacterium]|nr:D-alanyl-D-alanine carboxypeptidase family protein [Steroidobacteraceae bacterium]